MKPLLVVLTTAALGLVVGCGVALAAGPPPGWSWLLGTNLESATIGQPTGSDDVFVGAYYGGSVPAQLSGKEFVNTNLYGFYEFEHSAATPNTVFLSETQDGNPTPMTIGKADGQDLTPLVVSGVTGMTGDLDSWQLGSDASSGIDAQGRLRLNGIVLMPTVSSGKIELTAILPDGSEQLLVPTH